MYIGIKQNIMSLLYTTGDIDNRAKRITKTIQRAIECLEEEIKDTYNIETNKVQHKETVLNKDLRFVEMVSESKTKDSLIKYVVSIDEFDEVDDEMLRVPLAELKLNSYLYMKSNNKDSVKLTVVLAHINSTQLHEKSYEFNIEEIREFFINSLSKYFKWIDMTTKWKKTRNESIKKIKFPFATYREGQEGFARNTYLTIAQNKMIFAEAPCGLGKSLATIFPATKSIGEDKVDKIFYLTAKTVGRKVAEETFNKMREQGASIRNITLTAKDKVCFKPNAKCNPDSCPYAKNYYGKVNDVIFEMLENESTFTRELIESYAKKHKVCPFELSLDLSLYSDAVICDYNYVFDPNVYLKRYFEEGCKCNCTFLIDEAHNLVDRARGMYSAEITKGLFLKALESCTDKSFDDIKDVIIKILGEIGKYEDKCKNGEYLDKALPQKIVDLTNCLSDSISALFHKNRFKNTENLDKLGEVYTVCSLFSTIAEIYDEKYYNFYVESKEDTILKLLCIDPSKNLKNGYKKGKSAVIFSATLSPMSYFKDILGGEADSYTMRLGSPFDVNNREIIVADNISTRYKDRLNSYDEIVEQIYAVASGKIGNYMVFAPSFEYMNKIKEKFDNKYPDIKTIAQDTSMSEFEREVYLSNFEGKVKNTMISFNVISGLFSEGIDLKGEKLIGAIIVGVGLPMICFERNQIKDHFQNKNGYGFDFAYTFPGLNKVVQAAGRVIRTDNDKGIILLIDDRFSTNKYKMLLPKEWSNRKISKNVKQTKELVDSFWNK